MKRKGSVFSKLISMITYKEPKKVKEFYLPEINEGNHGQWQNPSWQNSRSEKKFRDTRRVKTPIPAGQCKKLNKETR